MPTFDIHEVLDLLRDLIYPISLFLHQAKGVL
jgi:hypothetical protein